MQQSTQILAWQPAFGSHKLIDDNGSYNKKFTFSRSGSPDPSLKVCFQLDDFVGINGTDTRKRKTTTSIQASYKGVARREQQNELTSYFVPCPAAKHLDHCSQQDSHCSA